MTTGAGCPCSTVNMSCATVSGVISAFIGPSKLSTTSTTGSPFGGRMLHLEAVVHSKEWMLS